MALDFQRRRRATFFPHGSGVLTTTLCAVFLCLAVLFAWPPDVACSTPPVSSRRAVVSPAAGLLDINTASAAELRALPGMGDVYVKRVIDNRPYTAKNQLVTRGILPQAAYERIRDSIVAHRPSRS